MLIHPKTKSDIDRLKNRKPHAVIITGEPGSGKTYLCDYLAKSLLESGKVSENSAILRIDASSKGIDAVRSAKEFLSKKTTGKAEIRRIVIIERADDLVESAQNALLKTIEEPPSDTVIILLASDQTNLLTTITSRAQVVKILPVNQQDAVRYGAQAGIGHDEAKSMYFMSGGLPGLFTALLNDSEHPLREGLEMAKQIVRENAYMRLLRVSEISKDRDNAMLIVDSLNRLLKAGFSSANNSGNQQKAEKFHKARKAAAEAQKQLDARANTKLVLCKLFLSF